MFLEKGIKVDHAPQTVAPINVDEKWADEYRKTPFLMQAAIQGTLDVFQTILAKQVPIWEAGHICLSRRRKNSVVSNVIGCAAYHGHPKLLKFLLTKLSSSLIDQVNLPAKESQDFKRSGTFQPEYDEFTPLMLALVSEKPSLDVVKQLLAAHANFTFIEKTSGDNIIHLAARYCPSLEVLEYLIRSLD